MGVLTTKEQPAGSGRTRAGLRREIGVIGLLWASTGSIIGSGWLFGAQEGLQTAGPAALISWVIGGVAILIGYAILALNRILHGNPRRPEFHWRSAAWLPVYLVGLGVIVYLSTFGGTGTIPLWWDILVVAAFSLIIYCWARAVALPTERIEQMVREVVVPEETALAD